MHRRSHRLDRRALVQGVLDAPDLELASAVSRSAAGRDLGEALGREALGVPVYGAVGEALDGIDVLDRLHVGDGGQGQHAGGDRGRRGRS